MPGSRMILGKKKKFTDLSASEGQLPIRSTFYQFISVFPQYEDMVGIDDFGFENNHIQEGF